MKWILCDERLPKEGQMVLTTIRGHDVIILQEGETLEEAMERIWNDVCYVSVGFIGSDGWYGADGFPEVVHPIAWMPLPKPYTADRKTENSSDIPNNCEEQTIRCPKCGRTDYIRDMEKDMGIKGSHYKYKCINCNTYIKDEPTISKMEQVEDEPQIQLTAKCLNCNNSKVCKEKHWDGCVYEPKDEKTCETCRHWKYIAHEWQCEACKCQGYEPKDEPQTCEDCKHNGEKHAYDYACDKCTDMDKFQHEDEPQTDDKCKDCKWWNKSYGCHWKEGVCHYVPKAIIPKQCLSCDSASRIIEAYSRGFEDGAEAVKKMPQTDCAWK